jgi:hypothetical protein
MAVGTDTAVVARWSALVGAEVRGARFELRAVDLAVARTAVSLTPDWVEQWPPRRVAQALGRLGEGSSAAVALLALAKLAIFLDAGAEIDGETGPEIRAALRARYPGVATTLSDVFFEVDATLREDGMPAWGFTTSGETLPGIPEEPRAGKPHLDLWLQNLARADVHDRLALLLG